MSETTTTVVRLGNDVADEAADFGRRRVGNALMDARRNLSGVSGRWYPVILDLHRFLRCHFLVLWSILIVGMVLLLILWYGLLVLIPRGVVWFMRFGTGLFAWATWYLGFGVGYCSFICCQC